MLPIHRDRRQTSQVTLLRDSIRICVNKPSTRLIIFIVLVVSFWLIFPLLLPPFRHPHSFGSSWQQYDVEGSNRYNFSLSRPPNQSSGPPTLWATRADQVREAFLHAYNGYQRYAAPDDELLPVTNGKVNNFNGWGVSLIDSLDTMWLMGLHEQFMDAIPVVAKQRFHLSRDSYVPFFETVIRYLGGLLSAYSLSKEPIFLARADDLGRMLLPAFNTSSGLPLYAVNTQTGDVRHGWQHGTALWSEVLSCQMEYKYLAHLTGRAEYFDKVERVMQVMYNAKLPGDLFPTMWNIDSGTPKNAQYSVGAFADSAHEYLLKQWLLSAKSEYKARDLYIRSTTAIINKLLYLTPKRQLLYVTDIANLTPSHTFEHLSCFLPGVLALGTHTLGDALSAHDKQLHMWAALGLAHTCYMTYVDQTSGLGPDEMVMDSWPSGSGSGKWIDHVREWEARREREGEAQLKQGKVPPGVGRVVSPMPEGQREYRARKTGYLLRPETVESFYILWQTTGDEIWRERGWAIFEAIQRETRTESGYASINFVDASPAPMRDEMPSYFLAETLKYLYLLFVDEDLVPLDKWVFNTEAHPFPVFDWSPWEKEGYQVSTSSHSLNYTSR